MMTVVRILRALSEASGYAAVDHENGRAQAFPCGVPEGTSRASLWRRFADEINGGAPHNGLYEALLGRVDRGEAAAQARRQIEKDVHRTFGTVRGLRVPQQEALQSLRNVLLACTCPRLEPPHHQVES